MKIINFPARLFLAAMCVGTCQAAHAQKEPIESVVQRYRAYVLALDSPNPKIRTAAMDDFTRHILADGWRGEPPYIENGPEPKVPNSEWIARDLFRTMTDQVSSHLDSAGKEECLSAFRMMCLRNDKEFDGIWLSLSFGTPGPPWEPMLEFGHSLPYFIAFDHPDWVENLLRDKNDLIAVNAFAALNFTHPDRAEMDWSGSPSSVRRSFYFQHHLYGASNGAVDIPLAMQFLGDECLAVRWQAVQLLKEAPEEWGAIPEQLVKNFRVESPALKWSALLFGAFSIQNSLLFEAKRLRTHKDAALRGQALMYLFRHGQEITDEEARFGFTHCYRELKSFWLEEVRKHPGLKDFAKQAQEEVKALGS